MAKRKPKKDDTRGPAVEAAARTRAESLDSADPRPGEDARSRRRATKERLSARRRQLDPDRVLRKELERLAMEENADVEASRKQGGGEHAERPPIEELEVPEDPESDPYSDLPDPGDEGDRAEWLQLEPEQVGAWLEAQIHDKTLSFKALKDKQIVRRRLPKDVDPHVLKEAGWGIICRRGKYPKLKQRLKPLIELREKQLGRKVQPMILRKGETAAAFLKRKKETIGTIDPKKVPYYLLILGGPDEIPFDFQYQLGVNHAVGRLHFDKPLDYERYALHIKEAETGEITLPRRAVLFSVENEDDETTDLLARQLVAPLYRRLGGYTPGWGVDLWSQEQASKDHFRRLVGGEETPGLLLASCHGRPVEAGLPWQHQLQGSLMCQRLPQGGDRCFTAYDVPHEADLHGLIGFLFACYSAGTPTLDNFPQYRRPDQVLRSRPGVLAEAPFVAKLPQALLSRGASAIVGHVDRGWTLSFAWSVGGREISSVSSLEDSLKRLLMGDRLGHALAPLKQRSSDLADRLAQKLDRVRQGVPVDLRSLGEIWTAYHDARNFIVLGDPAVYLLGQRTVGDLVRLSEEVSAGARELAKAAGKSLDQWVDEALEGRIRQNTRV